MSNKPSPPAEASAADAPALPGDGASEAAASTAAHRPSRSAAKSASTDAPYKNPALPAEKRVADLLSRMTLEEKAAQMMCVWQKKAEMLVDAEGNFDLQKAKGHFQARPRPRPGRPAQRRRQRQERARRWPS